MCQHSPALFLKAHPVLMCILEAMQEWGVYPWVASRSYGSCKGQAPMWPVEPWKIAQERRVLSHGSMNEGLMWIRVGRRGLSIERQYHLKVSGAWQILGMGNHPIPKGSCTLENGRKYTFWVAAMVLGLKLRPGPLLQAQPQCCYWVPLFRVA